MSSLTESKLPPGYQWMSDRALVGFEPHTQLQPWHYLPAEQCFFATERWPGVSEKKLLAFARRQDCDDLACFIVDENGVVNGVALIHTWTPGGFELVAEFPDFWTWIKHVIDDIADWMSTSDVT
ncbi:hypothetical protein [Amantichitinum ursilacus]|uniref:hypothetical protein n=1 Tax=Amantichitinum ursilacus TaxID=857265 RepID=UPI00128F3E2D|nr:hypothetical protein [Amantichitinum ursilacus]